MSTAALTKTSATSVRELLQVNVAILLAMSGIIFACAEGSPLAAVTVPVAWIGLMFVDRRPLLRLNVWAANGLGLLALIAVAAEFSGETVEVRLLAFGHFLCYLSWILLLQEKKIRQIWWLCALSVLQVATSAVLTNSPWLGLALIIYVTFALFTLSVFSLYRAVSRSVGAETTVRAVTPRRTSAGSVSRNAIRWESAARWITPRFIAGTVVNGMLSIFLGLVIFIVTPRVWVRQIDTFGGDALPATRRVTGVSQSVTLGDLGQILENRDLVLEVRFTDLQTDEPMTIEEFLDGMNVDAPLYRGVVLDDYENGRWKMVDMSSSRSISWRTLSSPRHYYRQDVRLRPTGTSSLFVAPRTIICLPKQRRESITHEVLRNTFHRDAPEDVLQAEVYEYAAISLAPDEESQGGFRQNRYQRQTSELPDGLEPVRELAERILQSADPQPTTTADKARKLLTRLRDSGEYGYSLSATVQDPEVDPVVDFLLNRKQGHCEYFASALALMLRAVEIPSRLVSGYKGGVLNEKSGYYEVRQLHAHAWVEAYIDGEWVVLDPTPAARDQSIAATTNTSYFWTDFMTRLRDIWNRGMLLSKSQQQRLFFDPLQESAGGLFRSFMEVGSELSSGFSATGDGNRSTTSAMWLLLSGLLISVGFVIWLAKFGLRIWSRRTGGRAGRGDSHPTRAAPPVPFYERFRDILARTGRVRSAAQTQREFAAALQRDPPTNGHAPVGDLPHVVTTAFYEVRFGNHPLPPADLDALNTSLDQWEHALQNGNHGNGAATRH